MFLSIGGLDLKFAAAPRDVGIGEDEVGITLLGNQDTRAAIIGGGDADGDLLGGLADCLGAEGFGIGNLGDSTIWGIGAL